MRTLRLTLALMLALPMPVYADKPEDKGKDNAPGQARQEQAQEQRAEQAVQRAEERVEQAAQRAETRMEQAQARAEQAVQRAEIKAEQAQARAEQAAERSEMRAQQAQAREEREQETADGQRERATDRRHEMSEHGREHTQTRVASLLTSLNALEHARWNHNPHDTRGQGNMGQPAMQDPFGFDRNSGREGQDRGRPCRGNRDCTSEEPPAVEEPPVVEEPPLTEEPPVVEEPPMAEEPPVIEEPPFVEDPPVEAPIIEEPTLNLAELVTAQMSDPYVGFLQDMITWAENLLAWANANPTYAYSSWYASYASSALSSYQQQLTMYQANPPDTYQAVLYYGDPVEYSLSFASFEGIDQTNLIVTTQLVSAETVSVTGVTGDWQPFSATYETGQVLMEQTQTLDLSQDSSFSFSLDPSAELLNGGYFNGSESVTADVVVTITDPDTGASYTMTLDNQIRLIDPYGIVYDKATGRPIAGATVTVHHTDGSVVTLDRSANPNVSNPQTTDATGRYSCKLAAGKYYLTVKASGYREYRSPMFSEQGHIVREDVGMTPINNGSRLIPAITQTTETSTSHGIGSGFIPGK